MSTTEVLSLGKEPSKMAAEEVQMKRLNRFKTTEMTWQFGGNLKKPAHFGLYVPGCPLYLVYLDVIKAWFRSNSPVGEFEIELFCKDGFTKKMKDTVSSKLGAMVQRHSVQFKQITGVTSYPTKVSVRVSFNRVDDTDMCDTAMECFIHIVDSLGAQAVNHKDDLPYPKILQETFVDPDYLVSYGEYLGKKHSYRYFVAM